MKKFCLYGIVLMLTALIPLSGSYTPIFNQSYNAAGNAWISIWYPGVYDMEVADNFSGINDPINKFTFYGSTALFNNTEDLIPIAPAPTELFDINFYAYQQEWNMPPEQHPGVMAPTTGTYTVNLYDTYYGGNGWQGGLLDVYVNEILVLDNITLEVGQGPEPFTFPANAGDYIVTVYVAGTQPWENWYQILDPDNNEIARDSGPYDDNAPTGIGHLTIPFLLAPVTGTYTIYLYDSYSDGWANNLLDVYVNDNLVLDDINIINTGFGAFTFTANAGQYISTVYTEVEYGEENWYQILDPTLTVIAQDGDNTRYHAPVGIGSYPDPALPAPETGTYTVNLYEYYGDGWQGGLLDVYVNGNLVLDNITLVSGHGPQAFTFPAALGDDIATFYTMGRYDHENWYQILDPSLNVIAQDGDNTNTHPPTGIGYVSIMITQEPTWDSPLYSFGDIPVLTSFVQSTWGGWSIYKFEACLPTPVALAEGWVSAKTEVDFAPGQWFLWWSSLDGDGESFQKYQMKANAALPRIQAPGDQELVLKNGSKDQLLDDLAFELATLSPDEIVISEDPGTPLPPGVTVTPGGTMPPELPGPDSGEPAVLYTIEAVGTWDVVVYRPAAWTVDWYCWIKVGANLISGPNPIPAAQLFHVFTGVNFDLKGEATVVVNDDQTLPVELSSFTATITADNYVSLAWTTQSETGVAGYYIYRGYSEELAQAQLASPLIAATNTSQEHSYRYTDSDIFDSGIYYYWLHNQDIDGSGDYHGPISISYSAHGDNPLPGIPVTTDITSIYPNPFNPLAYITYGVAVTSGVTFLIYNARGQLVRKIDLGPKEIGNYRLEWNGTDDKGKACATGVYYIQMTAGKSNFMRKAVLLK